MTKIAIITDTHFGVRGDSQIMLDHQTSFFENVFFPKLKQDRIRQVIHMGDLVDRRKNINFNTLQTLKSCFLDKIEQQNIWMDVICGNHDVFYKSTNALNALDHIVGDYENIVAFTEPMENHDLILGESVLYLPWINPENAQRSADAITNSKAKLVFGHLEISGFEMLRGIVCDHGLESGILQTFESVYTGHFHHPSSRNNIHYLGAPYQMTWSDYDSPRGFHVFDTETREMEFVPNPKELFVRISYKGNSDGLPTDVFGSYVKVVVVSKDDPYAFDQYIAQLESTAPADIKIVEPLTQESNDDIINQAEDTPTIINHAINRLPNISGADKKRLRSIMHELYTDALNISTES